MKKFFTLVALCVLSIAVMAEKQISGIIVDEKDEPVIGASIQVDGTTQGTITDYDGEFELSVPDDAKTLTIRSVGMAEQNVAIQKVMRIVMKEAVTDLQEVVKIGYANVAKGSFTGSAQSVDAEAIEKKSPSEISKAMAGEIAGVQVVNTSGQPGTSASIRIRGIGSVNASSAPLYVVDGVPFDGDIASIDPGDIADYNILKDASAAALYGSRGANGVIVITTKRGSNSENAKIDVDVTYGANMHLLPMYEVMTNPQEYVETAWMSMYNSLGHYENTDLKIQHTNDMLYSPKGLPSIYNLWNEDGSALVNGYTLKFRDGVSLKDHYRNMTSWEDAMFRVGQKAQATVRISGGTDKTSYYTSFGYLKDEGYYIGSDFDRFTVRSNINHQAKKWLKGGLNMSYTYSSLNNPGQGDNMNNGFAYVNGIPAIYPVFLYNADGTIQKDPKTGNNAYDYGMREGEGRGFGSGINPAGALLYDKQRTKQHQVLASGNLEFKLYDGLKLDVIVGAQYVGSNTSDLTNKFYGDAAGIGRIAKQQYDVLHLNARQTLSYIKSIGDHNIDVMGIHETDLAIVSVMAGQMNRISDPNSLEWGNAVQMGYMTSYKNETAMESYMLAASYSYDDRYSVEAKYRAQGSSKFAKGHRWGHFGSIGVAWQFTNESFIKDNQEWLDNGKLRLNWGMLGNDGIGADRFQDQYSLEYVDGQLGYVWGYKGNPDITWERSQQVDLGLEFSLKKYLDVEIDYFYKLTDNMLMPKYKPMSIGYSYIWINGGSMMNTGVEFQLNAHCVDALNHQIKLDVRLNGGWYHNKILSLPKDIETDTEMTTNGGLVVGKSLYDYSLPEYAGVDPETGEAQYYGYYDANKGGKFDTHVNAEIWTDENGQAGMGNYISDVHKYRTENPDADIRKEKTTNAAYAGSDYIKGLTAEPSLAGGFTIDFEAYGVMLSASCSYGLGGYGYDNTYAMLMGNDKIGNYNWHVDMRNMWTEENRDTNVPRLNNGGDRYTNYTSTRFLTSNNYLSLNNVRLGYSFKKKLIEKIKLSRLEFYVQGDNLAIATARKGYNPTVSGTGTSDSYQYTPLSTIIGGIKVQF